MQKLKGESLCLEADKLFFGLGKKKDKNAAIELYKESAENDCTKAMLALAAIYEPTDTSLAFQYYDQAATSEPYALFKLGEFMEKGLYDEGYRSKPNSTFALAFYKRAS